MVMFFFASNIEWVIAARAVQGLATGAVFSTFTAALVELPPRHRELGPVIGSVAPAGGIGLGALLTGAAIQFTGSPAKIVFACLAFVTSLGIGVAILSAETVSRRPGARRALRPNLSIPGPAVREFVAAVPLQIGAWMFVGLFLGLIPTIIRGLFHTNGGLVNGATVFTEAGMAAIVGLFVGRISPRISNQSGGAAIIVGSAVVIVGVAARVLPLLVFGGLIGGIGVGILVLVDVANAQSARGAGPEGRTVRGRLHRGLPRVWRPCDRRRPVDTASGAVLERDRILRRDRRRRNHWTGRSVSRSSPSHAG
jgi:hypothetical protein